jgi:hypothetical protein
MIKAYLKDNIIIRKIITDQWGVATPSDITKKGRFEFRTKLVRNLQGEQVASTAKVFLPLLTIEHKDKIVYDSKEYSILTISVIKDFSSRFLKLDLA